ncbi:MAG: M48 family metalloprotease, partial [Steroidobacteraceae bacterium]
MSSAVLLAQEPCTPPSLNLSPPGRSIFSERQEEDLGDIMAQRLRYLRVSDDPSVTAYMARIGDRLAQHLPSTQFHFRYLLVDSAWANAFSLPGGRIYVSRGTIAQLRGPDEMAAILAHEMGHVVTHQGALDATLLIEQVLGVTEVTDRQDIQKKLDDLGTNWRRNPAAFRQVARRKEQEQLLADQVALYAITAAGYSPEIYPVLFDRIANTGGKTGDWLSDLLHVTPPDQLRLREMLKAVEALPKACIARQPEARAGEFKNWQTSVFDFSGWTKRTANLHG